MKLLFAYFDCGGSEAVGAGRGLGEQSLNFSTEYDFAVRKELLAGNNGTYYWLSSKWKPEEERIPAGFWSNRISEKQSSEKRIYNVSALVGSNGSGKSTLLHSLIKTLVEGLDPGIPFLLVLRETGNTEPYVYSNINRLELQEEDGLKFKKSSRDYPEALRRAKIMLIDNTLSVSSMDLMQKDYEQSKGLRSKIRSGGSYRQFCNKSLSASIQYSNDISEAWGKQSRVFNVLANHFQYESYQEIRTLFDPSLWDMMRALRDQGHFVPNPHYLYVSVESLDNLRKTSYLSDLNDNIWEGFLTSYSGPFLDMVYISVLLCLYEQLIFFYHQAGIINDPDIDRKTFADNHRDWKALNKWMKEVFVFAKNKADEYYQTTKKYYSSFRVIMDTAIEQVKNDLRDAALIEKRCSDFQELFCFLEKNQHLVEALFQPCSEGTNRIAESDAVALQMPNAEVALYRVDIEQTLRDEKLRSCLMNFLQAYRAVSSRMYFLSFSSGLSSGEKNLLRMLAQLRYLLVSPAHYKNGKWNDNYKENDKQPNVLWNLFDAEKSTQSQDADQTCDTLFLLLDEADLTYHPEWQRRFVDLLCAILPEMFRDPYDPDGNTKGGCKDIQVILATHSPLMLGDFPKASTVYLDAGSSGEAGESPAPGSSFGQNLYTILREGFFMEDSMGEFAKRKINAAAAWCAAVRELAAQEKKLKKKREQSLDQNCESSQEEQRRKELGELKQRRDILKRDLEVHKATARLLSPGIIREKLLLELAECETLLGETRQNKRLEREALERKKQLLREKLKEAELELQALEEDDE